MLIPPPIFFSIFLRPMLISQSEIWKCIYSNLHNEPTLSAFYISSLPPI